MKPRFLLILVCGLVLMIAGCGYTTRALLSERFKTIHIPPFKNQIDITKESDASRKYKIYQPLLETDITREVIDRFMFDGNLRVTKEEEADLVLFGALVNFRRDALRYTDDEEEVEEYRISITVDLRLLDSDRELLWEERGFVGDTTYFVSGPNAKSEAIAVDEAVQDLARRVVERVIEDW